MQGNNVRRNQADQHQGNCNDVERKEAVQGGVADDVVTANPHRQVRTNKRNGGEQVHDDLRAPE